MEQADFMFLRPFLVKLPKNPARHSIDALRNGLKNVQTPSLQVFQEYIFLPLLELLKTTPKEKEIVVDIVNCIKDVIHRTRMESWNLFSNLSFQIIRVISVPDKSLDNCLADVSDELKQAVIICLEELIVRCSTSVIQTMFSEQFAPRVGHIIYQLLQLAKDDQSRETRILAMNFLRTLTCSSHDDAIVKRLAMNCIATFLPGILIALTKVATESGLAGQKIIVTALKTWEDVVFIIYDDKYIEWDEDDDQTKNNNESIRTTVRSKSWIKMTQEKIYLLVTKIGALAAHSKWKVRLALAEWASSLLLKCKRSLAPCVSVGLSVLITLSADVYAEISQLSKLSLEKFSRNISGNERSLLETLQENLFQLTLQLPGIFKHSSDALKLSTLDQLYGYLNILGVSVNVVLNSKAHLEKLSFGLLHLSEMDCTNVRLIAEKSINDCDVLQNLDVNPPLKLRKQFVHFNDENIYRKITEICRILGKYGDLFLLTDHLLERFHESSVYKKQSVLLLNEIMLGTAKRSPSEINYFVSAVVDEYLDPSVWNVQISSDDISDLHYENKSVERYDLRNIQENSDSVVDETLNTTLGGNALLVCLLLEGISNCAQVLGDEFNKMLMRVLHNVLEKLGSSNAMVSHTAYLTLDHIASYCNYSSISEVILRNADYLLNYFSIKLRYSPLDPKGPTALRMALQHSDEHMINLAQDVVDEILINLDTYHSSNITLYLGVLHALVTCIVKFFPNKELSAKCPAASTESRLQVSLYDFIVEYDRLKKLSDSFLNNESSQDDENEDAIEEPQLDADNEQSSNDQVKSQSPVHVKMTVKVLQRCSHLLSSNFPSVTLSVLSIMDISVQALQSWEDDLLPMVHKLWAPLVRKFDDDKMLIVKAAFRSLCTMARICGDFLRPRIMKEVWPKILSFLEKQTALCKSKETTLYRHTATYKLLVEVLCEVGYLAESLAIPDLELDNLASVTVTYLSSLQPTPVQTAAVKLFEKLSNLNPDLIWLKLNDLYSQQSSLDAHNFEFPTLKIGGVYDGNIEFKENVIRLLDVIDKINLC